MLPLPWGLGSAQALLVPAALLGAMLLAWRRGQSLGAAALKGAVAWGWGLWALSEGLSLFSALRPAPVLAAWSLACLGLAVAFFLPGGRRLSRPPHAHLGLGTVLAVSAAASLILLRFRSALFCPTWNFDSELYHMPRVQEWAQQGSLIHFPTSYDLQVFYPPWAEEAQLHLRLLSGDDLLADCLQWGAWLFCAVAAAEAAAAVGGRWLARAGAALAVISLPMAVLQAGTGQNDLVAAAWVLAMATLLLRRERAWAAAAAGLALATKGTSYFYVAPLGLWLIAAEWQARRWAAWRPLLLAAVLAFTPSLPHWARNHAVGGHWLGSAEEHRIAQPSPASFLSNTLKEGALELTSPLSSLNYAAYVAVAWAHQLLRLPLDHDEWIWGGLSWGVYLDPERHWHEDYSGAPLHLLLLLGLASLALSGRWRSRLPWAWQASALGGLGLFLWLLRYNPWCTRLHLSFFILSAPWLGLALESAAAKRRAWAAAAILLFLAQGWWVALDMDSQPFSMAQPGKAQRYWHYTNAWQAGYRAAHFGSQIGLVCPERTLEYGVWRGARESGHPVHLQHLSPSAATASLLQLEPYASFKPEVLLLDGTRQSLSPTVQVVGRTWALNDQNDRWGLYLPKTPTAKR
jgi:hypothetical protein